MLSGLISDVVLTTRMNDNLDLAIFFNNIRYMLLKYLIKFLSLVSYTHLDVYKRQLHDHRRNTDIRQELNIMSILDRIAQYRLNW